MGQMLLQMVLMTDAAAVKTAKDRCCCKGGSCACGDEQHCACSGDCACQEDERDSGLAEIQPDSADESDGGDDGE